MSPAWRAEWAVAVRRRRLLVLNVGIPLLLVAPLTLAAAPPAHSAAALAVLFLLFPLFGSAIPLVRDGDRGLTMRFLLAGDAPRGHLAGRLAAQAGLDLIELTPSALLVVVTGTGGSPREGAVLVVALAWTLVLANVLGAWIAASARSLAEAALFSAVGGLLLLHAGGTFRTPAPGTWQAALESAVPVAVLHESVLAILEGGGSASALRSGGVVTGVAFLLLTWVVAPTLFERLAR